MKVTHNISALNALRNLGSSSLKTSKSMGKLATGQRINSAADDAAGLSISEKMRGQIRGLNMAARNIMDGISFIQTVEGALNEQHAVVQRMRELTLKAANDTNATADRTAISYEVSRLIDYLDNVVQGTEFNTQKVFLGLDSTPTTIQVGANEGDEMDIYIQKSIIPSFGYFAWEAPTVLVGGPGADQIVDLSNTTNAFVFLAAVDKAIQDISSVRGNLGASQNRLEHTLANVGNAAENLTAAESRIRDTDMAKEMMEMVRNQILQQAGTTMLAQGMQQPQNILRLLSA